MGDISFSLVSCGSFMTKLSHYAVVKCYKGDAVKKQSWARLIVNLATSLKVRGI